MNPNETLSQMAKDAEKLLPELLEKQKKLHLELNAINAQINAMQSVINSVSSVSSAITVEPDESNRPPSGRASPGEIEDRIDDVLSNSIPLSMEEIRRNIHRKYGVIYGNSSMHSNLKRGEKKYKYIYENGKWSMHTAP